MWVKLSSLVRGGRVRTAGMIETPSGVYMLRWTSNNKPREIRRLLTSDSKGIMYIGGSKRNLKKRIHNLTLGILGKRDTHTAVKSLLFTKLIDKIDFEDLEVAWMFFAEEEAEEQEASCLKLYADRYGEPPPLNLQLGRYLSRLYGRARYGTATYGLRCDQRLRDLVL